ncbi:hypothetical protein MRX96_014642 [Rhipicephalus microplus]
MALEQRADKELRTATSRLRRRRAMAPQEVTASGYTYTPATSTLFFSHRNTNNYKAEGFNPQDVPRHLEPRHFCLCPCILWQGNASKSKKTYAAVKALGLAFPSLSRLLPLSIAPVTCLSGEEIDNALTNAGTNYGSHGGGPPQSTREC